ncbi:hypothetical protein A2956_01855 [Candidatus Roizmanbacteria bacterium RIFCSPLOWO2_01_FULL_37_57]|nr:MAG: hypothetical protein A2956_01855 [Candidatus Roizmanbacteria bacterium RIFCSPLOWO2_01_FULL_37_57]
MIHELFLDLLFPKACFSCGKFGRYICISCAMKLRVVEGDVCPYCEKGSLYGLTHPKCKRTYRLDGLRSVYYYDTILHKIIKEIKYRCVRGGIKEIMSLFPQEKMSTLRFYYQNMIETNMLPVPLHRNKLKLRGFNQSLEIANFFSNTMHIPMDTKLIYRKKDTFPQAQLKNRRERFQNVRGAFKINIQNKTIPRKIIIIDDVWTSGSTTKEIGRVLKRSGVEKVFVLTIAR